MHSKVRILVLILISCFYQSNKIFPQSPWTLEECIDYALKNNIQVKQQKLNTEYNQNILSQSRANLLPSLSASGSYGSSFGRALDQSTYEFTQNQTVQSVNVGISSSLTIFSGLQKLNTIKKNEFDLRASLQDLEKLKNDISLNIAAAYLQILFNKELLDVAKQQLEITSQQVIRTKSLVDAGSLAMGSLLEIQAQQASEELQIVNYENALTLSYLELAQILDLDSLTSFSIVIPEISGIDEKEMINTVDDVYSTAESVHPQIKASEYRLESAGKNLLIARGSRIPRLSLSANYGTVYSDIRQQVVDFRTGTRTIAYTSSGDDVLMDYTEPVYGHYPLGDQFRDNASSSVFLNLSIPIFTNFQIKSGISNARINLENSHLELDNARNILYKDIQQAYADALAALKKYKASEKALTATQESFNYTKEKYEVGLVNTVDFNIAKTQLVKTQSDLVQAKYDYIFKTNILNFYRGEPIKI